MCGMTHLEIAAGAGNLPLQAALAYNGMLHFTQLGFFELAFELTISWLYDLSY